MSVLLSIGSTTVDLQYGPEWGGQSSVELALTWEQMADGRWRVWDRGLQRDIWSCQYTWVIPSEQANDLRSLVEDLGRGQTALLTALDGIYPFGPLVVVYEMQVRVTASESLQRMPVCKDWPIRLSLVADPHPAVQNLWHIPEGANTLGAFLSIATASPSAAPAWGVQPTETGFARVGGTGDSFSASLRAKLNTVSFSRALQAAQALRGGLISIPASTEPWGPGIAPNDNGFHRARLKAFSWSRLYPDLWEFSITAVQEPTA